MSGGRSQSAMPAPQSLSQLGGRLRGEQVREGGGLYTHTKLGLTGEGHSLGQLPAGEKILKELPAEGCLLTTLPAAGQPGLLTGQSGWCVVESMATTSATTPRQLALN